MSLAGTHELPLHAQEETEVEAELLLSREGLDVDSPVQGEPGEPEVTLSHTAHNSESLSISPDTSATAHAEGALALALQSSLPGKAWRSLPALSPGPKPQNRWRLGTLAWLLGPYLCACKEAGCLAKVSPG